MELSVPADLAAMLVLPISITTNEQSSKDIYYLRT